MVIKNELREQVESSLEFYTAPCAEDLKYEVRRFLMNNHGYGKTLTMKMFISYLRHNYTNWPLLSSKLQDVKMWGMHEHHEIRDYVNDLVWEAFYHNIPWDIGS